MSADFIPNLEEYLKSDSKTHVISPIEGKEGEESVLIFIIGAKCDTSAYVDHLKAIQQKTPFPLWIVIPEIFE